MDSITTTLEQMAEVMEDDELTDEEKLDIISEALISRAQERGQTMDTRTHTPETMQHDETR